MDLPPLQTTDSPGECAICYEAYRICSKSRAPKTLQCSHSLCQHCLRKLVCHTLLMTFVVCPFCRRVTIIPEAGVQGLKTDEETLGQEALRAVSSLNSDDIQSESSGFSSGRSSPSPSEAHTHSPRSSIFTISDVVPSEGQIWGGRYMREIRSTYLLGISRRVELSEATHPTLTPMPFSADSMRLCFALGLIICLACVFFIFIFFK